MIQIMTDDVILMMIFIHICGVSELPTIHEHFVHRVSAIFVLQLFKTELHRASKYELWCHISNTKLSVIDKLHILLSELSPLVC